jgi:hypothetical protein
VSTGIVIHSAPTKSHPWLKGTFTLFLYVRELSNEGEAELVSQLTLGLLEKLNNQQLSIGIITPYHKQRTMILSFLNAR